MTLHICPWRTLKARVTLLVLSIFLASMWALAFYASRVLREDMQRQLSEQQLATVGFMATEINNQLTERLRALEEVAGHIGPALLSDTPALQRFLEVRPVFRGLFNNGAFVTWLDGTAIAAVPFSTKWIGVNYLDVDAVATAIRDLKSGIGRPVIDKELQVPVVLMATPIRSPQGQAIGALVGVTNLDKLSFLENIARIGYGKTGTYSLISRAHRQVVLSSEKGHGMSLLPAAGVNAVLDRALAGEEASVVYVNTRGTEVLSSARSIPVADWHLAASLPVAEAFAPIDAMQRRMLLVTLALTLLAAGLTWWLLRRQLLPLEATVKTLAALSEGTLPAQALTIEREDEIGQLIKGFNRLLTTLAKREALLKQVLDTSSVAIFLINLQGCITLANQRMAEMFGYPVDALVGSEYLKLVHPSEREVARQKMNTLLAQNVPAIDLDRLFLRADGSQFWGHLTRRSFYDTAGEGLTIVVVIADITERKKAEQELMLAASVFTHAREGIIITDAVGKIVEVNDAFSRITGYTHDEVIGQEPSLLNSDRQEPAFYAAMWRSLVENGHWHGELWNQRKSGELFAEMLAISAVRNEQGETQHYVALFSDITALKEHEQQLDHIAHFDALTNLPNRVLLADRLQQAMLQTLRRGQRLAVVYLDLDGFKAINDRHGHEAGDQMLMTVSANMKQALREGDTLARIGGDEFVAVLLDLGDSHASVPMLTRLLAAAAEPMQLGPMVLQVSASVGVSFYPQVDEVEADQLLRQADQAMYQAKLAGKNRYQFFDAEQDRSVRGHHESLERIQQALRAQEFVLHYQPKVNMRSGVVIGVEALIRWQHPDRGLLAPALFLPVVEDHPLALALGEWVIHTALAQMECWQAAGLNMPVSVNVGARQLQQVNFVARLREILAAHPGVKATQLELEVLETSALEDLAGVSQVIKECQDMGVLFAMDDFGTGYSSLTYLKRLHVALLKIDQSFVHDMLDDPDDLAILEGVISLARAFRRQVIAEGVETVAHGTRLLQLGCELAQGFGIARPMPASDLPAWVAGWRPDAAWTGVADAPAP